MASENCRRNERILSVCVTAYVGIYIGRVPYHHFMGQTYLSYFIWGLHRFVDGGRSLLRHDARRLYCLRLHVIHFYWATLKMETMSSPKLQLITKKQMRTKLYIVAFTRRPVVWATRITSTWAHQTEILHSSAEPLFEILWFLESYADE